MSSMSVVSQQEYPHGVGLEWRRAPPPRWVLLDPVGAEEVALPVIAAQPERRIYHYYYASQVQDLRRIVQEVVAAIPPV
jgi:hypothetical protein